VLIYPPALQSASFELVTKSRRQVRESFSRSPSLPSFLCETRTSAVLSPMPGLLRRYCPCLSGHCKSIVCACMLQRRFLCTAPLLICERQLLVVQNIGEVVHRPGARSPFAGLGKGLNGRLHRGRSSGGAGSHMSGLGSTAGTRRYGRCLLNINIVDLGVGVWSGRLPYNLLPSSVVSDIFHSACFDGVEFALRILCNWRWWQRGNFEDFCEFCRLGKTQRRRRSENCDFDVSGSAWIMMIFGGGAGTHRFYFH